MERREREEGEARKGGGRRQRVEPGQHHPERERGERESYTPAAAMGADGQDCETMVVEAKGRKERIWIALI